MSDPGGYTGSRNIARLAILLLAITTLALLPSGPASAADRAFTPRFTANDTGDIDIVGNTLMTCQDAAAGCTAARTAAVTSTANTALNNNNYASQYVDVDGDPSTFDSSQSTVALPTGATVLFAGLYWGGEVGTSGTAFTNRGTVKLKAPGGTYTSVTASTVDDGSVIYQGFADVTSLVSAGGNGVYTVANVQALTGTDRLAGWSLVIAYHDAAQPARNLTVFDGLKSISASGAGTINVSGFRTPPSGAVNATVGFVTYEGDLGLVGDGASLNGIALSDAQHPATNFFDSRSSRGGVLSAGNNPSYPNNLGYEHSQLTVGNTYIANGATSATIGLTTAGDQYAPGVVTVATDLYAPKVTQTKTVTDVNGGNVEQGDVLRYTITGTNTGLDGAAGFVVRDPVPTDTTYVPGSIKVTQPAGTTTDTPTDAVGDDTAEHDAATGRVVARIGAGAGATSGGLVPTNGTYTVTFDVTVNGPALPVADGSTITNTATATFTGQTLGTPYSIDSSATTTVRSPDLTMTKTHAGTLVAGTDATYTLTASNVGHAPTQGVVTLTDLVPAGLTAVSASGTGWTCTVGASVTCTRSDALAAGASHPPVTFVAHVTDDAPATVANTATVAGGGDASMGNNAALDAAPAAKVTDLVVSKTPDTTSVSVGGAVRYALTVTNHGPSRSTGSVVVDHLPAGLTYVSDDGACVADATSSQLTCPVGALAASGSATVHVVAKPAIGTAGTSLTNTVTVTPNETDPSTANDTASSTIDVKPLDLAITSHVQGDPAALVAGSTYNWLLDVTSTGGSPAADTDVRFTVPAGLTVDPATLDPRCTIEPGAVVCHLGTVAATSSVPTIAISATVAPGATGTVDTNATVSTTENDTDPTDDQAPTSTPVRTSSDLGVTLAPSQTSVNPGDDLTLTATVTNAGPGAPTSPTVTFVVPAGTTFVSADPGCTYDAAASTVTCVLAPATLGAGATTTRSIVVHVTDAAGSTVDATVTTSATNDTFPTNDAASTSTPVIRQAGLSIVKTVDTTQAAPGHTVTYTLTVANSGPAPARDVVVADTLPGGVTYAGTGGAGTCGHTGPAVSCTLGTVAVGATRVVTITATVAPLTSAVGTGTHDLDVTKVETNLAAPAGATQTAVAQCPSGYLATDGGVRVDHVDDGTGSLADVDVVTSSATADGTGWTGTIRNGTAGQAQAKVEVVCVTASTVADGSGHQHAVLVSAPVSTTRTFTAGTWDDVDLACGPGRVAIDPSYTFTAGSGVVTTSLGSGTTRHVAVDVPEGATATFSVRCLSTSLGAAAGHTHDLSLATVTGQVTVPAGQSADVQLSCGDDAKGIVSGYDLDPGLVPLGSDPRPKTRDFTFANPTGSALTAHVALLCLDLRTGPEEAVTTVTNTASVSTSSPDADTADDSSSVSFTATPAAGPLRATPLRAAPVATVTGRATTVSVSSAGGGATVRLVALGRVRGTDLRRGDVLAQAPTHLRHGTTSVRLRIPAAAAHAVRAGHLHRARLVVVTAAGQRLVRMVRVHR